MVEKGRCVEGRKGGRREGGREGEEKFSLLFLLSLHVGFPFLILTPKATLSTSPSGTSMEEEEEEKEENRCVKARRLSATRRRWRWDERGRESVGGLR